MRDRLNLTAGQRVRLSDEAGGFLSGRPAEVLRSGLQDENVPFTRVRLDPGPETAELGRDFEVPEGYLLPED